MDEMREGLPGPAKEPWYESLNLEDTESFIKSNLVSAAQNVIAIGYYLKHIRDRQLYREAGYESIWDYASDRFGLSKSTTSRYISRNDKFSKGGNSPVLDSHYQDFGKAQLQEMLSLNSEQLEQVTPDMTVAQIRDMRKPKEVPYYPLEGQMEITEFLEPEEPVQEPPEAPVSFQMDVSELTPEEPEPEEPEQPPLPLMRNNDQRKEWLRDYKSWGLWYTDDHIGCRYYKYDFDNGARLIAEVYDNYSPFEKTDYESSYLHLVGGPEPDEHPSGAYGRWSRHERYNRFPNSETELVEFLKSIQKGERK